MASDSELRTIQACPPLPEYLRGLWNRREFSRFVPANHVRSAHLDTALGNAWFLLNPILQIAIYFLLFGLLIDADRGVDNYLAYLTIGVLSFNLVSQSFLGASRCIPNNTALIRSLYFPRASIPITALLSSIYTFGPALLVMVACALLAGESPSIRWLLLPVVLLMLFLILLGFVMAIARVGSYFGDLHSLLPHLRRMLFYGSGVLFDPLSFTSGPIPSARSSNCCAGLLWTVRSRWASGSAHPSGRSSARHAASFSSGGPKAPTGRRDDESLDRRRRSRHRLPDLSGPCFRPTRPTQRGVPCTAALPGHPCRAPDVVRHQRR